MKSKMTVRDINPEGKRVFVRVDFNVPMDDLGQVDDDTRIRGAVPTIEYLLEKGASVILASHLGRPKGKRVEAFSLRPVSRRLEEILGSPVSMADDAIGPATRRAVERLQPGQILLLENLRFHAAEELDDGEFARELASYADIYVNDAFGAAHRAHASTHAIASFLPAVAGLLMEREIQTLTELLASPGHPFVAVIGGAKISSKIGVLQHLTSLADAFIVGGAMANTLLQARSMDIGDSLAETDKLDVAREFLEAAAVHRVDVHLPSDVVVAEAVEPDAENRVIDITAGVPEGWKIVDVGPESLAVFSAVVKRAKTILWNGPLGVFEVPPFDAGTVALAHAIADSEALSVMGGGDSISAIERADVAAGMSHISTGGGATLEFLEGRELPGIHVLRDAD